MTVVSIEKQRKLKQRAKKRAQDIVKTIKNNPEYKELPPDASFATSEFEEEISKVLYEVEKLNDRD